MRFLVRSYPCSIVRLNRDRTNYAGPHSGISVRSLKFLPHDINRRIGILNQNILVAPRPQDRGRVRVSIPVPARESQAHDVVLTPLPDKFFAVLEKSRRTAARPFRSTVRHYGTAPL